MKLIAIAIFYRPPNQSKFLDIFWENLTKVNTSHHKIYFEGDFNISHTIHCNQRGNVNGVILKLPADL